jgi:hypothetical protein
MKQLVVFTYVGIETKFIMKLFKDHHIYVALRTRNILEKNLSIKKPKEDPVTEVTFID